MPRSTTQSPVRRPRFLRSGTSQIVVAVAAGLALAVVASRSVAAARSTVVAVAAAHAIRPWELISARDLAVVQISAADRTPGMVSSISQVAGQVSDAPIPAGTLVQAGWLGRSYGSGSTAVADELTRLGQPTMRAYTLAVSQDEGYGSVAPGVRTDLLASVKVPTGQSSLSASIILAQDVPVLAIEGGAQTAGSTGGGDVVLLVTPAQAQAIAFALANGTVSLLTNAYNSDPAAAQVPAMTSPTFVSEYLGSQAATTAPTTAPASGTSTTQAGK